MKNYSALLPGLQKYKEMMDKNPREEECKCPHLLLFFFGFMLLCIWLFLDCNCIKTILTMAIALMSLYPINILVDRNKNNNFLDKEFYQILEDAGFKKDEEIFDTREFLLSVFLNRYSSADKNLTDYINIRIEKDTNFIGQNISELRFSKNLHELLKKIYEIENDIEHYIETNSD